MSSDSGAFPKIAHRTHPGRQSIPSQNASSRGAFSMLRVGGQGAPMLLSAPTVLLSGVEDDREARHDSSLRAKVMTQTW